MTVTIKQLQIGRVGDNPQKLLINTDNTIAEVTTPGFLTKYGSSSNIYFSDYQLAEVYTTDGKVGIYQVSVDEDGVASLVANTDGNVLLPVTDKHFAAFYGTDGVIQDLGWSASDPSYTKVSMMAGASVVGNIPKFIDTHGSIQDGGLALDTLLYTSITTPDVNINLVRFDVTVSAAALASGASVTLRAGLPTRQYKIVNLWANLGGTNFSGGGGDRLLSITDNTTVYSVIPAASLQTLANAGWGETALPYPASAAINTSTAAGAALVAKYSGGAADYAAGSVVISGILQRVS